MITLDDIPDSAVEFCLAIIDKNNDITEEEVWNKAIEEGVEKDTIPNFSNIYLELLFERTKTIVSDTQNKKCEYYINNMNSSFTILNID